MFLCTLVLFFLPIEVFRFCYLVFLVRFCCFYWFIFLFNNRYKQQCFIYCFQSENFLGGLQITVRQFAFLLLYSPPALFGIEILFRRLLNVLFSFYFLYWLLYVTQKNVFQSGDQTCLLYVFGVAKSEFEIQKKRQICGL